MGEVVQNVGNAIGLKNVFKTPRPPEAPPAPSTGSAAVQQASSEAAQRRSRARGFRSTILNQLVQGPLKETVGS